jgi:predicted RNA-binding Zn ribbon-like protein
MDLAAPGDLEVIRRFVNTRDLELGTEALAAPADLDTFLGTDASTAAELERAIAFREALRALLLANATSAEPQRDALAVVAGAGSLAARPDDLALTGHGLARLLAIVVVARADGTWPRLKACPGDRCQWALYDHTRSRTRTWCSAAKCGARSRSREYRRRRAER